jgi:excisionase family DNA binding protein
MNNSDLLNVEVLREMIRAEFEARLPELAARVAALLPQQASSSAPPPLVNAQAASASLGVSETKLRQMVRAGSIPYHKIDGSYRFDLTELRDATRAKLRLKAVS